MSKTLKPAMTPWDKKVVVHLKKLADLDKAGKLKFVPIEQMFAETEKTIEKARARQRVGKAFSSEPSSAAYAV